MGEKEKKWYSHPLMIIIYVVLGLIILFFFNILVERYQYMKMIQDKDAYVEYIATNKGYEYVSSAYVEGFGASLHVKYDRFEQGDSVLGLFQTLNRVYENATSYFVEIEGRRDTCSYFMDGNIYRAYENSFSLENYYNYKNQLNKSENCE